MIHPLRLDVLLLGEHARIRERSSPRPARRGRINLAAWRECDAGDAALGEAIAESIRSICKLRGGVEIVASGSLPNDGKVIDDVRQYE